MSRSVRATDGGEPGVRDLGRHGAGVGPGVDVAHGANERAWAGAAPRACADRWRASTSPTVGERGRVRAVPGTRAATSRRPRPGPARSGGRRAGRPPCVRSSARSCGVSMPTWTTPWPPSASRWARASRSPNDSPTCGTTTSSSASASRSSSDRAARSRSPVSATTTRHAGCSTAVSSVSSRAAAARSAAGVVTDVARRCGSWLGLAPAPWRRRGPSGGSSAAPPTRSRGAACAVPRSEPETFDRVPAARGRYAMSSSRTVQPASGGLDHQLERVAEPTVSDVERQQVVAAADPHGREVVDHRIRWIAAARRPATSCRPARARARHRDSPDDGDRRPWSPSPRVRRGAAWAGRRGPSSRHRPPPRRTRTSQRAPRRERRLRTRAGARQPRWHRGVGPRRRCRRKNRCPPRSGGSRQGRRGGRAGARPPRPCRGRRRHTR